MIQRVAVAVVLLTARLCLPQEAVSLPQLQQHMIEHNLELKVMQAQVDGARAVVRQSRSAWQPRITALASYQYVSEQQTLSLALPALMGGTLERTLADHDRVELGLDISYPVFSGFSRWFTDKGANKALAGALHTREGVENSLSLQLGQLYFAYLLAAERIAVQQAQQARLDTLVAQTRLLLGAGMATQAQLSEAEAHRARARLGVVMATNSADSLAQEVSFLTGVDGGLIKPVAYLMALDTVALLTFGAHSLDMNRPELAAAGDAVEQLRLQRQAAASGWLPSLAAMGGVRYGDPGIALGEQGFSGYWMAGAKFSWTLYDGALTAATRQRLEAQQAAASASREQGVENFRKNIVLAQSRLRGALQQIEAAQAALDAATRQANDSRIAREAGVASSYDYISALWQQTDAQLQLQLARTGFNQAALRLVYAVGEPIQFSALQEGLYNE
jgi:outer membrane protein TolC